MLEFKPTGHSYYCETYEYDGLEEYETFDEYLERWDLSSPKNIFPIKDMLDFNFLVRYDLSYPCDPDTGEDLTESDYLTLQLCYLLQRHGKYKPVIVEKIYPSDIKKLNEILATHADYMKHMWCEFMETKG